MSCSVSHFVPYVLLSMVTAILAYDAQAQTTVRYVDADVSTSGDGSSWANAYKTLTEALAIAVASDEVWIAAGTYYPSPTGDQAVSFAIPAGVRVYGGFAGTEANRADRDWLTNLTTLSGDYSSDDTVTRDGTTGLLTFTHISENAGQVVTMDGTAATGSPITSDPADASYTTLDGVTVRGGNSSSGGGLYCDGSGAGGVCSPAIANVIFLRNVGANGGAVYIQGASGTASPVFADVTFSENSAGNGGGVYVTASSGTAVPVFERVAMFQNSATNGGGGVYVDKGSSPVFTNVVFAQNAADPTSTTGYGGAIHVNALVSTASLTASNVTFADNAAYVGGAVFIDARFGTASVTIDNAILWGNTAAVSSDANQIFNTQGEAAVTLRSAILQGVCSQIQNATCTDTIAQNPLFADATNPSGADGRLRSSDDGLNLQDTSPALNVGNNTLVPSGVTTDITGGNRILQATVDLGAYEQLELLPSTYFVNGAVSASGDGLSWGNAFKTLTEALAVVNARDEVWVAAGTYTPSATADREASFRIPAGVRVYGGFAGTETNRADRDWVTNVTKLSGDYAGNDVVTRNAETGDLTFTNNEENAYTVVRMDGTQATGSPITSDPSTPSSYTVLDGVTIRGGNSNNSIGPTASGGGFLCDGSGLSGACSPVISNVTLVHNYAFIIGGGFVGNLADGGISSPVFSNVTVFQNEALTSGGGMALSTGLLFDGAAGTSTAAFTDVSFVQNYAGTNGGSGLLIYNNDGGSSNVTLSNATFAQNGGGEALLAYTASGGPSIVSVSLAHATIVGNTENGVSTLSGDSRATITLDNSILWGNTGSSGATHQFFTSGRPGVVYGPYILRNTLVEGGCGTSGEATCTNVSTADPLFVDANTPNGADGRPRTADDGLALLAGSPALDAGDNALIPSGLTTDITGGTRIVDGTADMGAYEGASAALPVELVAFDARLNGEAILLTWATASETNNAGFAIEQQAPGGTWDEIAFIAGVGTTLEARTYSHIIRGAEPGIHRFRLRQVDYDGTFAYGPDVELMVELAQTFRLSSVYPNPFNPSTQFTLSVREAQQVAVVVYDITGREVERLHDGVMANQTTHTFHLNAEHWASGLYLLRITGERFNQTRRLTRVK